MPVRKHFTGAPGIIAQSMESGARSQNPELKLPAARPVDETCRRAQVVSLRSSRCRESSKCKEEIPF
jgi:hypothetical protein